MHRFIICIVANDSLAFNANLCKFHGIVISIFSILSFVK